MTDYSNDEIKRAEQLAIWINAFAEAAKERNSLREMLQQLQTDYADSLSSMRHWRSKAEQLEHELAEAIHQGQLQCQAKEAAEAELKAAKKAGKVFTVPKSEPISLAVSTAPPKFALLMSCATCVHGAPDTICVGSVCVKCRDFSEWLSREETTHDPS